MKGILKKFLETSKQNKNAMTIMEATNLKPDFQFNGFAQNRNSIPFVDNLSDEDLQELNTLLDWNCFVVDNQGRRFGNVAWTGKRVDPQIIPDYRHKILNEKILLADKHILEIGCFEGIHTIGLCQLGQKVTAVDSRIENIIKTIVRTSLFGHHPTIFKVDVEDWATQVSLLKADVCHHVGVLYHLKDPVKHLLELFPLINSAILLDTHVATQETATESYITGGISYSYKKHMEGQDVFSGMYDHAKWLTLDTLTILFNQAGFQVELLENRQERNGPRILLFAKRDD